MHGAVVAEIEQGTPAVLGWWAIVGVFDQAGKGVAGVAWIDPVAVGHLAIKREDQALGAVGLTPVIARAVIGGERGYEATGEARGEGGDDAIKCPRSLVGAHFPASIIQWLRGFNARAEQNFASRLADALYESFVQKLEAAAQVAQIGSAVMEARPEPGEGDLAVHIAKFCGEEWLKDHAVRAFAHPAAQPWLGGL